MEYKHLVCVTDVNNNKYYDMQELDSGRFEASYGRIGVTCTKKVYPMHRWDEIYNQKLRKGYEDVTSLAVVKEVTTVEKYKPIPDPSVAKLIEFLREQARDTVKKNYIVGSDSVSPAMIRSAQDILNRLSAMTLPVKEFNEKLLELFKVIPRRMSYVPDYLASNKDDYEKIIHREQELLDVMEGQVTGNSIETHETGDENRTVLEVFGLEISPATDEDIKVIKKELGKECEGLFHQAWRVENKVTRKKFKDFCKGKGRLAKKLFWHGSRTENWWGILRTGLVLRPTNVVINGKMFGYGLYFAPRARKSVGYTSLRGSCWAGGTSQYGFLSLYEVAYGKPYDVSNSHNCGDMSYEKLQRVAPGCSCLHAHAGNMLRNDEVIVYREDQTTIKYLVELKN